MEATDASGSKWPICRVTPVDDAKQQREQTGHLTTRAKGASERNQRGWDMGNEAGTSEKGREREREREEREREREREDEKVGETDGWFSALGDRDATRESEWIGASRAAPAASVRSRSPSRVFRVLRARAPLVQSECVIQLSSLR
ncbi:hypothetical protein ALC53_00224 [Atta colombica]|uniref:Uncharacterized protein n=1 Tax=Atta colombica TaxID=520822 RepID=A0A195BZE6_9HYME|nr:hypothetical protein ALC53_00224 [Atta colombica]